MPSKDIVETLDEMTQVIELKLKGYRPTEIMRSLGITRNAVDKHVEAWRSLAVNQLDLRERAHEMLVGVDQHYDTILKKTWEVVEESELESDNKTKLTALKLLAQLEKDRVGIFQQAGVADDTLAKEIAENERKQKILVDILRDVTGKCSKCKIEVRSRLAAFNNSPQVPEVIEMESVFKE